MDASESAKKPVVVVLISRGGGGHVSAAEAIRDALQATMDVRIVNLFEEICVGVDHVSTMTGGRFSGEDLYNLLQRRGYIRALTFYTCQAGRWGLAAHAAGMAAQLTDYLRALGAAAVISTVPFVNDAVAGAARALDLPAVVVACDYDARTFAGGRGKWAWERFRMTMPMDHEGLVADAVQRGASRDQIRVTGYPVRTPFKRPISRDEARGRLGLASDRPIVLFVSGASGADRAYGLVRAALALPVRLLVGVGRNAALGETLSALPEARSGQLQVVGFTPDIATYLAACDVFVTKTGSGSISEALCAGLAPILETSSYLLPWERTNATLFPELGVAEVAASGDELVATIARRIERPEHAAALEARVRALPRPDFGEALHAVLRELGVHGAGPSAGQRPIGEQGSEPAPEP